MECQCQQTTPQSYRRHPAECPNSTDRRVVYHSEGDIIINTRGGNRLYEITFSVMLMMAFTLVIFASIVWSFIEVVYLIEAAGKWFKDHKAGAIVALCFIIPSAYYAGILYRRYQKWCQVPDYDFEQQKPYNDGDLI